MVATPKPATPVVPSTENQSDPTDPDSPEGTGLSSTSSSSSESDLEGPVHRSQLFKRPPRFQKQRPRELMSYDEDPEEGDGSELSRNVSLPFAQAHGTPVMDESKRASNTVSTDRNRQSNPSSTQRAMHDANARREAFAKAEGLDASSSLASSASDAPKPPNVGPGPLSPKHRAELAKLSPRRAGKSRREGSEGTPSMGSSFSDIDGMY